MLITANNNNFNDTQKHNSCQTINSNSGPKNNQRGLEMYLQQQQQQQLLSCESLENIGLFASRRGVTIYLYDVELCFMYIFLYLYWTYCLCSMYIFSCYLYLYWTSIQFVFQLLSSESVKIGLFAWRAYQCSVNSEYYCSDFLCV